MVEKLLQMAYSSRPIPPFGTVIFYCLSFGPNLFVAHAFAFGQAMYIVYTFLVYSFTGHRFVLLSRLKGVPPGHRPKLRPAKKRLALRTQSKIWNWGGPLTRGRFSWQKQVQLLGAGKTGPGPTGILKEPTLEPIPNTEKYGA